MHNKSSISHESIYESKVPVAKCHLRKLLKKRVISLILLEITEYHLSTLETFSILFRTTSGKKTLQFPVLHYNHHVEHKMASYNLQQQKKNCCESKEINLAKK